MPIDHEKLKRLKRQQVELDGAFEAANAVVEAVRYGDVPSVLRRLSSESPFNLPLSCLAELRELVEATEVKFKGADLTRLRIGEGQMLTDCRSGRTLIDAYERLAEAQQHLTEVASRRTPLSELIRRLDEYIGVSRGLDLSPGVRRGA